MAAALAIGVLGLVFAYWSLVIAEGAYFGPKVVTVLYDRTAGQYDALKDVPRGWDEERLADPLLARLGYGLAQPPHGPASWPPGRPPRPPTAGRMVLDLATGTARLPIALLSDPAFAGTVVGLDLSGAMLEAAWRNVGGWSPRVQLVRAPAVPAPFSDETFSAVTMLEALEFTPRPRETLAEMVRLLAPGGTLVVTNRIGWEARLLPRRAFDTDDLIRRLDSWGLGGITKEAWQTHYDLIWASKPGSLPPAAKWADAVRCPACAGLLVLNVDGDRLICEGCGRAVQWHAGSWDFEHAAPSTGGAADEVHRPAG